MIYIIHTSFETYFCTQKIRIAVVYVLVKQVSRLSELFCRLQYQFTIVVFEVTIASLRLSSCVCIFS